MEQSNRPTPIDPNDLLIFARVAELGSFSRAAEQLCLPKSTVSRRLGLLEQRLGERLLLRTTRRQTLTDWGQQLLEHARQVASEVDAVTALTEHRHATPSGRLRVSMPSDFANLLLGDAIAAFTVLHPAITLELDLSPRRVDLLAEGFDLAVRMGDLPDDASLSARPLAVFEHGLFASPDYLIARGEPATPHDLHRHDAVLLAGRRGPASPWRLNKGNEHWEGTPTERVRANSPELLIRLAAASAGVAAVPEYFAEPLLRAGQLRRVLPGWSLPSHRAWAVFPERRLMPAKTRVFIDMLVSTLTPARHTESK